MSDAATVVVPVILAGGSGTRLWPLSRALHPKQYLSLGIGGKGTLFQQAALRLATLAETGIDVRAPCIVANEEHRFTVVDQLREIGVEAARVLLEPVGRNTAPALALAALEAVKAAGGRSDPGRLACRSRDRRARGIHVGATAGGAHGSCRAASSCSASSRTGPTSATAISAPKASHATARWTSPRSSRSPISPPPSAISRDGGYYWNSGMFVLRASVWLAALGRFRSDVASASETTSKTASTDGAFLRFDAKAFAAIPADSIDYAVMEPASRAGSGIDIRMVPLDAAWSDLGAWDAVWQVGARDGDGNATQGDTLVA